ncbi:Zn(II)2Cys6 transcription factor domain-containing protein [Aspergillus tanneri]|uniref:Zn(2)-C6 fungal-type domain-containing protein n=1 Tax=Aspergillus tanneri TaxID=1220188 RepID=A0A5M9MPW8_9EURO|nr:uncharacterized protein ATNIH1004_004990 [Aspergillus tanneri]KAA8649095.1 hypothetical protein ATNIH1004_004990 [Aspergillus tanneri]
MSAARQQVLVLHPSKTERMNSSRLDDDGALQTVFRLTDAKNPTVYHARRPHKKSRGGCITCKRRRVKCDERKPCCRRCEARGTTCSYVTASESLLSGSDKTEAFALEKPSKTGFSLSLVDMRSQLEGILSVGSGSKIQRSCQPFIMDAFQHFFTWSVETVGQPGIRDVMKRDMVEIAFTNSHLMYTLLGVGMLHLNRVKQPVEASPKCAEAYFWQQAIQLYQAALLPGVSRKNVDALISTCMFISLVSLCPDDFKPTDSWVFTNNPADMNWLYLQSGLRCILQQAEQYLNGCIWGTAFMGFHEIECQLFNYEGHCGPDGLDPLFADFCGIDEYTNETTSPYYTPLKSLTTLLELEKNLFNASMCTTYMGRLEFDFLALLQKRDPAALMIIAHWMGLMCLLTKWQPWVEGRIRAECIAICMFFERSTDPRVPPLLEFPAFACGYAQFE